MTQVVETRNLTDTPIAPILADRGRLPLEEVIRLWF